MTDLIVAGSKSNTRHEDFQISCPLEYPPLGEPVLSASSSPMPLRPSRAHNGYPGQSFDIAASPLLNLVESAE